VSDDRVFCADTEPFRADRQRSARSASGLPLGALDVPDGPVVDIGAGAGVLALAVRFPDGEIFAVEPSHLGRRRA
jgi:hypothetical protein